MTEGHDPGGSRPRGPRPRGPRPRGRRAAAVARRRLDPLVVLAVVVPMLTVGALGIVHPSAVTTSATPPDDAPLSRATLVCPPGTGQGTVVVGNADPEVSGTLLLGEDSAELEAGRLLTARGADARVVAAVGETAPGLAATRIEPRSGTPCGAPVSEQWFTGVGAGAEHRSVLTLVNPDRGPAVAEVTVLSQEGPIEVPELRGLTVAGGSTEELELADVVPRRDELSLRVSVTRGRLGTSVRDYYDPIGGAGATSDYLAAQREPATTTYLTGLGATTADSQRVLSVANPTDDEVRVAVKVLVPESEFAPTGLAELRIPPQSTVTRSLTRVLAARTARDAVGLRLDASAPVTASLRTLDGPDLTRLTPAPTLSGPGAMVVPAGRARLYLAGAQTLGVARLELRDARGRPVDSRRVALDPGRTSVVDLPPEVRWLGIVPSKTSIVATVALTRQGLTLLPVPPLAETGRVAQVRPSLS